VLAHLPAEAIPALEIGDYQACDRPYALKENLT